MMYRFIAVTIIIINTGFIFHTATIWDVPKYFNYNHNNPDLSNDAYPLTDIGLYNEDNARPYSVEETYFKHIIRKIVEKSDPFINLDISRQAKSNDRDSFVEFLIRFDYEVVYELKKLIKIYDNKQRPNISNDYRIMIHLLDSFAKMKRKHPDTSYTITRDEDNRLWGYKFMIETSLLPTFCYYLAVSVLAIFLAYTFKHTFQINPLTTIISLSITHAIILEYLKLYYEATARKFSTLNKGIPEICLPSKKTSIFSRISTFVKYTFTFRHDECYNYYRHIHVEPILDVSLLEAISSVFRKFVASYVTEAAHTAGKSIYLLVYRFPFQWQFIIFFSSLILLLFYMILLFKIEIHTWFFSTRYSKPSISIDHSRRLSPPLQPSNKMILESNTILVGNTSKHHHDHCRITRLKRSLSVGDVFKNQHYDE